MRKFFQRVDVYGCQMGVDWTIHLGHNGTLDEPPEQDELEILRIFNYSTDKECPRLAESLNENLTESQHPIVVAIRERMERYWLEQADDMYQATLEGHG